MTVASQLCYGLTKTYDLYNWTCTTVDNLSTTLTSYNAVSCPHVVNIVMLVALLVALLDMCTQMFAHVIHRLVNTMLINCSELVHTLLPHRLSTGYAQDVHGLSPRRQGLYTSVHTLSTAYQQVITGRNTLSGGRIRCCLSLNFPPNGQSAFW